MLDDLKMRRAEIVYSIRSNGWRSYLGEIVFLRRRMMFVEKDLSEVVERPEPLARLQLVLLEIDKDMLSSGTYHFALQHRYLRALHYLAHGYGGFALARNNIIVGDMWYWSAEVTDDPSVLHGHLRWFGFTTWRRNEVYTFDIFVAPTERKQGISAAFQNNAMVSLASKGYTKAYGSYFADNIPAVWCTRVTNKWKEVRAVSMSRFLMFRKAVPLSKD
jgi:GNAT superfamily N-acetyltransferase